MNCLVSGLLHTKKHTHKSKTHLEIELVWLCKEAAAAIGNCIPSAEESLCVELIANTCLPEWCAWGGAGLGQQFLADLRTTSSDL